MSRSFQWNPEKGRRLEHQRGVSFERVVAAIEGDGLVDVLEHPNQERYPGQMTYVVEVNQYLHLLSNAALKRNPQVPFWPDGGSDKSTSEAASPVEHPPLFAPSTGA